MTQTETVTILKLKRNPNALEWENFKEQLVFLTPPEQEKVLNNLSFEPNLLFQQRLDKLLELDVTE